MIIRFALLMAVLYFVPKEAYAKNIQAPKPAPAVEATGEASADAPAADDDNEPEEIMHRKGLAVHLGLSQQEVVFGKPRNFRSESLNNFGLDPITDEEQ